MTTSIRLLLIVSVFVVGSSVGFAREIARDAEEIPFDQVVRELNARVSRQQRQNAKKNSSDPYENLQMHWSMGLIQSANGLSLTDHSETRMEDGMLLGVGIDLFSPEWVAEGLLKNYGQSHQNNVAVALREFDLRLSYLKPGATNKPQFRFTNGLGARYLRYHRADGKLLLYQTTPIYLLGMGLQIPVGSHFDIDVEMQGHASLVKDTIDRHGLSLALRLVNTF